MIMDVEARGQRLAAQVADLHRKLRSLRRPNNVDIALCPHGRERHLPDADVVEPRSTTDLLVIDLVFRAVRLGPAGILDQLDLQSDPRGLRLVSDKPQDRAVPPLVRPQGLARTTESASRRPVPSTKLADSRTAA